MKKHLGFLAWLKKATDEEIALTGTTRAYLRLIAYGHKTASAEIAARTESATKGVITRKKLRPNDWRQIWPELSAA